MTAQEFLDLSTKLSADLTAWVAEAAKDAAFSPADLATLSAAARIFERVTLKEIEIKPDNPHGQILI